MFNKAADSKQSRNKKKNEHGLSIKTQKANGPITCRKEHLPKAKHDLSDSCKGLAHSTFSLLKTA